MGGGCTDTWFMLRGVWVWAWAWGELLPASRSAWWCTGGVEWCGVVVHWWAALTHPHPHHTPSWMHCVHHYRG